MSTPEPRFCKQCVKVQPTKHTPRQIVGKRRITIECVVCDQYLGGFDAEPPAKPSSGDDVQGGPVTNTKYDRAADLTDQSMMPFGSKYGPKSGDPRKLGDVPAHYLLFIGEQAWIKEWPGLHRYIEQNRKLLEKS